ncbi:MULTISPECIES: DUF317 domain-containing protein [unclassified Streptomyces]|uniref:DUF317 domain-containing protein n=1 Tax=unclassified Streptomyces TaxID=2593676 RepID=UPI002DD7CAA6|nr:DUF317 domain-containing protein [Streptomyces sp. NBC_01237]WRZ76377.1 DUF317 domain-containing protein [Streptomyces sp. NBC_01237]
MSHERFYSRVNGPTLHRVNTVRWLDEVSPRHLAGGGDPRHVTEHLLASGWSSHSVPGFPHVLLESPDHRLHLTLEPQPDAHSAWWRIHPAENRMWSAQFNGHTPVEMIAKFTDALDSPAPRPDTDLWHLAASRGWSRLAGREQASVQVSVPLSDGQHRWVWNASIDETAPAAALAGFVTALTEPGPLLRDEGQTPALTFGYLDSHRSVVTPEQHRRQHLQRLEAAQHPGPPDPSPSAPAPPPPQRQPRHKKHR